MVAFNLPHLCKCNYCGDDEIVVTKDAGNVVQFFVLCCSCGARGPLAETEQVATEKWNTNHGPTVRDVLLSGGWIEIPFKCHFQCLQESVYTNEQVKEWLKNPNAFFADLEGVSEADFIRWLDCEGTVTCNGITKARTRCKCVVGKNQEQMPIKEWLKSEKVERFCKKHKPK